MRSRTGRRFTYCWKVRRIGIRRPQSETWSGTPGAPTAPRKIASQAASCSRPSSGIIRPVFVKRSQLQSNSLHASSNPNRRPAASSTRCPSGTTSLPIPSPGITAMRWRMGPLSSRDGAPVRGRTAPRRHGPEPIPGPGRGQPRDGAQEGVGRAGVSGAVPARRGPAGLAPSEGDVEAERDQRGARDARRAPGGSRVAPRARPPARRAPRSPPATRASWRRRRAPARAAPTNDAFAGRRELRQEAREEHGHLRVAEVAEDALPERRARRESMAGAERRPARPGESLAPKSAPRPPGRRATRGTPPPGAGAPRRRARTPGAAWRRPRSWPPSRWPAPRRRRAPCRGRPSARRRACSGPSGPCRAPASRSPARRSPGRRGVAGPRAECGERAGARQRPPPARRRPPISGRRPAAPLPTSEGNA